MPLALQYASSIIQPMADKIDTIDVTAKARELKVAEDYAVRLMAPNYALDVAKDIALNLVQRYAAHGFVIDRAEAGTGASGRGSAFNLSLNIAEISREIEGIFTRMTPFLTQTRPVIGRIHEVAP